MITLRAHTLVMKKRGLENRTERGKERYEHKRHKNEKENGKTIVFILIVSKFSMLEIPCHESIRTCSPLYCFVSTGAKAVCKI